MINPSSLMSLLPLFELPNSFTLHAFDEVWSIQYIKSKTKLQIIERPHREVVLVGHLQHKTVCIEKMKEWIKSHFQHRLISQFKTLSDTIKLPYKKISIRDQKTLWGSCTSHKSISLNFRLIFLPKNLVRYVMIHELCHTKHLNHSDCFWQLVANYEPCWHENRRALRNANQYLPAWLDSKK